MTKLKLFSVYDSKAKTFDRPFTSQNSLTALRMWTDLCNDPKVAFSQYPEDYSLFEIGEFAIETALIIPLTAPVLVGTALEYKKKD